MRISDWSSDVCSSDLQLFGRQVGRPARPAAPQRPRELLPALVAFLREGIDFAPLPGDDLREDMRGRAKAVKSDAPAVACHSQREPADQACAKQGGRLHIGKTRRQRKAEMRVRTDMGRIAAIPRDAGEHRMIAEIFPVRQALGTNPATLAKPGHADTLTSADNKSALQSLMRHTY